MQFVEPFDYSMTCLMTLEKTVGVLDPEKKMWDRVIGLFYKIEINDCTCALFDPLMKKLWADFTTLEKIVR